MTGVEISLDQMLLRREKRFSEQKIFLEKFNAPLISFSMNIPGPVKTNESIFNAFIFGKKLLLDELQKLGADINQVSEIHEATGDELLLSVKNIPPDLLKDMAVKLETKYIFGRLFDIDVINSDGEKLSRKNFRKCLICEKQAQDCARSRAHSVNEMQKAVENLLAQIPNQKFQNG